MQILNMVNYLCLFNQIAMACVAIFAEIFAFIPIYDIHLHAYNNMILLCWQKYPLINLVLVQTHLILFQVLQTCVKSTLLLRLMIITTQLCLLLTICILHIRTMVTMQTSLNLQPLYIELLTQPNTFQCPSINRWTCLVTTNRLRFAQIVFIIRGLTTLNLLGEWVQVYGQ